MINIAVTVISLIAVGLLILVAKFIATRVEEVDNQ